MLRIVIDRTTDAMRVEVSSLYLLERREGVLRLVATNGLNRKIIEKGRLQREAERKLREVSALFEVSNILTSTLELDEVLSLLVARLVRVYPGSAGAVFLRDGDELRERARSGEPGKAMAQTARQALNEARPIVAGD